MFKDKVVLITEGSAGIGAATAEKFAKEEAKVVIVGKKWCRLNLVTNRCLKHNHPVFAIKTDLSKDEEADSIVKKTIREFGRLDILVNIAAVMKEDNILDDEFLYVFDDVYNVNIRAVARVTHHAAPYLIKSKGNIVNVSSVVADYTNGADFIALRTSKAALTHFTRCCAVELAEHGVRVNSISPGPVRTNIFEGSTFGTEYYKANTALNRITEADKIADLILYMSSDKANVTGSNYIIDNGLISM